MVDWGPYHIPQSCSTLTPGQRAVAKLLARHDEWKERVTVRGESTSHRKQAFSELIAAIVDSAFEESDVNTDGSSHAYPYPTFQLTLTMSRALKPR